MLTPPWGFGTPASGHAGFQNQTPIHRVQEQPQPSARPPPTTASVAHPTGYVTLTPPWRIGTPASGHAGFQNQTPIHRVQEQPPPSAWPARTTASVTPPIGYTMMPLSSMSTPAPGYPYPYPVPVNNTMPTPKEKSVAPARVNNSKRPTLYSNWLTKVRLSLTLSPVPSLLTLTSVTRSISNDFQ